LSKGILDRALSTSFIAALPQDELAIVRSKVLMIVESESSLATKDFIQFPYVTNLHLFGVRG
jgi:hypothetical protein